MARVNQHHRESLAGDYVGPDGYHEWPIGRYGNWRDDTKGPWLVPEYLSGSDYSGGLVTRSNVRVWREMFAAGEDDWWCEVSGGHGTYAIVVKAAEMPNDALETLCALSDYPLISEDDHSALEIEAQDQAWEDTYRHDLTIALDGRFGAIWEEDQEERRAELARYGTCPLAIWPEAEGTDAPIMEISNDRLFDLFREGQERANVYWEDSEGEGVSIDLARIVDEIDDDEILAAHNATALDAVNTVAA